MISDGEWDGTVTSISRSYLLFSFLISFFRFVMNGQMTLSILLLNVN